MNRLANWRPSSRRHPHRRCHALEPSRRRPLILRMPTWGEILNEINTTGQLLQSHGLPVAPFDIIRRKYLAIAAATSQRPVILYASAWLAKPNAPPALVSVSDEDLHGFMEAVHGI